jgi:hypothetical protein
MEPADLRDRCFQRAAEVLWCLAPRPLAESFAALAREHLIRTAIEVKLRLFADRLAPDLLGAIRCHDVPCPPLRISGRR